MSDFCQKHASYDQCGRAAERWLYGDRDSVYDRIHGISVSGRRGGGNHHSIYTNGGHRSWDTDRYGNVSRDHITIHDQKGDPNEDIIVDVE